MARAPYWQTGDLNGDGCVELGDLATLLAAFGRNESGDLNEDGETDAADLAIRWRTSEADAAERQREGRAKNAPACGTAELSR